MRGTVFGAAIAVLGASVPLAFAGLLAANLLGRHVRGAIPFDHAAWGARPFGGNDCDRYRMVPDLVTTSLRPGVRRQYVRAILGDPEFAAGAPCETWMTGACTAPWSRDVLIVCYTGYLDDDRVIRAYER